MRATGARATQRFGRCFMATAAATNPMAEKIAKLLAQAKSTTFPEEAQTALAMARDLMAKYRVDQAEVDRASGATRAVRIVDAVAFTVPEREAWMDALALMLAKEFRCQCYVMKHGAKGAAYCLYGLEDDAAIAQAAMTAGYAMSHRTGWRWCGKTRYPGRPKAAARAERLSCHEGFNKGLKSKFDDARAKLPASHALVLHVPAEVMQEKERRGYGSARTSARMHAQVRVAQAWGHGYEQGRRFDPSNRTSLTE
jgi:hypothetical protein